MKYLIHLVIGLLLGSPVVAELPDSRALDETLVQRINAARQALEATEQRMAKEGQILNARLSAQQRQVQSLREKAAGVQRLAEEKTMGLDALQTRVSQWRAQSQYQQHLIAAYVEKNNLGLASVNRSADTSEARIGEAVARVQALLEPQWQNTDVVLQGGEVVELPLLAVGPVKVTFNPVSGEGGLVVGNYSELPHIQYTYSKRRAQEIADLHRSGNGLLAFDPTLGSAHQLQLSQGSVIAHLEKGGVWALPIVFFGALSFVIALIKAVQLLRLPPVSDASIVRFDMAGPELKGRLDALETLSKNTRGALHDLLQIVLKNPASALRDDLLVACLREHRFRIERFMGVVATSAAVAPLLGLLGTVSGMITTFKMMTIFGAGDAATVSGGISEALVTTELGLIVAIPSLIVSALLTRKAQSYNHRLETFAIKLSKQDVLT